MSLSYNNINEINKINSLIEGYVDLHGDPALANRPLPPIKQCPCSVDTRHDLSHVKANYDGNYTSSSSQNTAIPVVIQRHKDNYYVLENKDYNSMEEGNVYEDKWLDIPKEQKEEKKMGIVTQFYYGSISVVALYVVFRMIQRSR